MKRILESWQKFAENNEDKVLIDREALTRLLDEYEAQELTLEEGEPTAQQQCNKLGFMNLRQWLLRQSAFIDASKGHLTKDRKATK